MNKLRRTTITIPETIYTRVRTLAALEHKSLSRYISDSLKAHAGNNTRRKKLPIGKYNFGIDKPLNRKELYEPHLTSKVSD